jgi:hypothetical protein
MTHTNDIAVVAAGLGSVAAAIVLAFLVIPWVI